MRKRALSNEGLKLYLNATDTRPNRHWLRRLVCGVFHTQYDDHLLDVVCKCKHATQALAAEFDSENMKQRLDAGILHTVRLIITRDDKKVKRSDLERSFQFFMDVMHYSYQYEDYQTVHMLYLALTHKIIKNLNIRIKNKDIEFLKRIENEYGGPSYEKHVDFWKTVKSMNALPSLIAFDRYITRREFMGRYYEANEAKQLLSIYPFIYNNPEDIIPLYNQIPLRESQLIRLTKKFKIR
jgi:hypothetical protein